MSIIVNLNSEIEELLRETAAKQGRDVSVVAAELLTTILKWETEETQEAVKGIQRGLDDFEAGKCRSFAQFAEEQRRKYHLPVD
jgi:predicted transcriptional regulator